MHYVYLQTQDIAENRSNTLDLGIPCAEADSVVLE